MVRLGPLELVTCLLLSFVCRSETSFLSRVLVYSLKQAMFEQQVEDVNAVHKMSHHLVRRLIVLPLTDAFNPNPASGMFGKVQYGDKCSLPASLGRSIFDKPYEAPWIFEVTVPSSAAHLTSSTQTRTNEISSSIDEVADPDEFPHPHGLSADSIPGSASSIIGDTNSTPGSSSSCVKIAYLSPLDFRAPENYIFMPRWLMTSLGVRNYDVVDVSFLRVKLAGLVVLQPLSPHWDEVVGPGPIVKSKLQQSKGINKQQQQQQQQQEKETGNEKEKEVLLKQSELDMKALLEQEINKYSSLTAGTTIYLELKGRVCAFFVKDTQDELGLSVRGVRVQDADVRVDIDRTVLDAMLKKNSTTAGK